MKIGWLFSKFGRNVSIDCAHAYFWSKQFNIRKLTLQVWADAASQVLYSYSVGGGAMVAMGSYNDKHHDFIK